MKVILVTAFFAILFIVILNKLTVFAHVSA